MLHVTQIISDSYNDTTNEVILDCFVSGHPMPSVTWFHKDNVPITDSDIYTLITEGSLHRLIISQPHPERDDGEYQCHIANSSGSEMKRVHLDVKFLMDPTAVEHIKKATTDRIEKENMDRELMALERRRLRNKALGPEFDLEHVRKDIQRKDEEKQRLVIETYLKNTACIEGGTAYFLCGVSGKNPSVQWMHNGRELDINPNRYKIEQRNGVCVLQVQRVVMSDAGEFVCQMTNNVNSVTTSAQLIVQESRQRKMRKEIPVISPNTRLQGISMDFSHLIF